MNKVEELIKTGTATIVDVRTAGEFMEGNVPGSINIPLQEVQRRIDEFKNMKNIILCCASGGRSTQATMYLQQQGIDCVNGGSWLDLTE